MIHTSDKEMITANDSPQDNTFVRPWVEAAFKTGPLKMVVIFPVIFYSSLFNLYEAQMLLTQIMLQHSPDIRTQQIGISAFNNLYL
jgi:hypothetical protein